MEDSALGGLIIQMPSGDESLPRQSRGTIAGVMTLATNNRTSCSRSGGGDSTITTSSRQCKSWTKTALGHEKHVVKASATEAATVVAVQVYRARSACTKSTREQRRCRCLRSTEGCLQLRGDDPASDEIDHQRPGRERNRHGEKSRAKCRQIDQEE